MKTVFMVGLVILEMISADFIAGYLQLPQKALVRLCVFMLLFWSTKYTIGSRAEKREKGEKIGWGLFALLASISIVLGFHIHVEDAYSGLITQNYIVPYTAVDIIAGAFIFFGIYQIVFAIYQCLKCKKNIGIDKTQNTKLDWKLVWAAAAFLMIAWLPYLLIYWPGFIFGDSMASLGQALGLSRLVNHHPVFYTMLIRLCLMLGQRISGGMNTAGIAIYNAIQMLYMAVGLGYMICWIGARGMLKRMWLFFMAALYGMTPYFATYSIAVWKDPIFSVTLVVLTLMLADFVMTEGEIVREERSWGLRYLLFSLVLVFSRNNGIYIVYLLTAVLACAWILAKRVAVNRKYVSGILAASAIVIVVFKGVTGPGYSYMGIRTEKVESVGIFLNQMARVAAYDGTMSEDDKEYMNDILISGAYKETYRPCCTDLLKWDRNFNNRVLEKDFFKHWFSMLVKNPRLYFEAWELNTYGFWTINGPGMYNAARNISGGVPRGATPEGTAQLAQLGIQAENLLKHEELKHIFVMDEWSVPVSAIHFLLLFEMIYLVLRKRQKLLLALVPSIGLAATLLIASPIYYWPRYGLAEQYLLPFYLLLLLVV